MGTNSALAFTTLKDVANKLLPVSTLDDLSTNFTKAQTILESTTLFIISAVLKWLKWLKQTLNLIQI
jgi:hypothetical protein